MKRLVTAVALIAVAVYLIFVAPEFVFMAAALLMGLLCYLEFSGLVEKYGIQKQRTFGIVLGLLILSSFDKLSKVFMEGFEVFCHIFGCRNKIFLEFAEINSEAGVVAVISVKRGTTCCRLLYIIVGEFG